MNLIENDEKLNKYFKKRHLEINSQKIYINAFKAYYNFTGLTPTEAISEADEDEEKGIRLNKRRIVKYLDDFEDFMEGNYKETTLKTYTGAIKSFYKFNRIQLPSDIRRSPNPTPEQSLNEIPGKEDIKKAVSNSNIKYQAIIVLLASSGMRQGDLRTLTLQHLVDSIKDYAKITVMDLYDIGELKEKLPETIGPLRWDKWMEKKRRYYTTFSTPESFDFILNYLETDPPNQFKENTILFHSYRTGGVLNGNAINRYFDKVNKRCKFPELKNQFIYFRPHNLRKWFASQLNKTELGYINTRHLLGHRIRDPTGRAYIKPDYNHLKGLYYKNMDVVTLFNKIEVHDYTDERVEELEKRDKEREETVKRLEKMVDDLRSRNKLK